VNAEMFSAILKEKISAVRHLVVLDCLARAEIAETLADETALVYSDSSSVISSDSLFQAVN